MASGSNYDVGTGVALPGEDVGYRPISVMSVICLGLAVVSAGAFMSPVLWFLPPFVLILSAFVSSSLEKARVEYGGQLLAKLSIFLSLAFLIAAPTRYFLERYIICKEAKNFSVEFVDNLLANRPKEAFVQMRMPIERVGLEDAPEEILRRSGVKYRTFLTEIHVTRIRGKLPDTQVTYKGIESYGFEKGSYYVVVWFEMKIDDRDYSPAIYAGALGEQHLKSAPYVRTVDYRLACYGSSAPGGEWKGRQWFINLAVPREKYGDD